ncbi:MAG: transcriptional regulator PpsR [Pseudomonadota bacterium]
MQWNKSIAMSGEGVRGGTAGAATYFSETEHFSELDPHAIGMMIASASDVAFVVSQDGIIRDLSVGGDAVDLTSLPQWRGAQMATLVTEESQHKLRELIEGAVRGEAPQWREINHIGPDGQPLPVRYSAFVTGPDDRVMLLGRDLRTISRLQGRLVKAQLALEQDYERFRQVETRYRVLFETTQEALVLLDADTGRIVDANPPASRLLGREARELNGSMFTSPFDGASQKALGETLAAVRATSNPRTVGVTTRGGEQRFEIRCILFRAARETLVLCRLSSPAGATDETARHDLAIGALVDKASDAIVVTDRTGIIQSANDAFLALAEIPLDDRARGQSLAQYLGRPGLDLNVMLSNAAESGRLSIYATEIRSNYGTTHPVEISTVRLGETDAEGFGFILRDVSRLEVARGRARSVTPESVEHVMELVGSAPLKDLVRATTDVVERMCIETALQLTNNNRASAAEMLGLSRQSLYVKLRKFGLIGANEAD